jgi:pantetheine-phosphate adenylyltransferase
MKVLFSGSFDPPTLGHLDIIKRASKLFDRVIVCIFTNPKKKGDYSVELRKKMIKELIADLDNVFVDCSGGSIDEYVKKNNIDAVLKGIRNCNDLEYENELAEATFKISGVDTVYLPCNSSMRYVSSSIVREMIKYNLSTEGYLDPSTKRIIDEKK